MKIFRHKNGYLYSIEQIGKDKTITPNKNWNHFYPKPYKTNKNAPQLESVGELPDLKDFIYEFSL